MIDNGLMGIEYLKNKLECKRTRGLSRYAYYEQKNANIMPGIVIPNQLQNEYRSSLGWCTKAVDSISDRLIFKGFENDIFDFAGIYKQNNPDILFDSAIRGALITSCDFIYISADANGFPRLQVVDGTNATGIIEPITNLLKEGYAVLERDEYDRPIIEAYFKTGVTRFIYHRERSVICEDITNKAPYPLLVPIIYKPDSRRPFGHSRISRTCMDLVDKARNTVTRGEVSAEFYSFPQKYVTGLSQEAEPLDKWKATISTLLQFDKDEDGDHPVLGQFAQQSMAPFIEQFKMYASAFGGETGLTLDDLGFMSGNPSSSDAIKATHETLRLAVRKAQEYFHTGFVNAGYVAACLRDNMAYNRTQVADVITKWKPIFEADTASLSGIGDAFIKLREAFPDYITEEKLTEITGL